MLGDIQTIGHLVNGVFDIEDPFFVEIQHDLAVFRIIRHAAIGVHLFNGEFQRLRDQIVNRGSKVHR